MEFLNDQKTVNAVLIFAAICIILILVKLSWVQDAIKDEIDDLYKRK